MQKWNGKKMCQTSFDNLQKGDRYVIENGAERVFDHFTKDDGAVNTLKKVNRREDMRWPGCEKTTKENSTMSGMAKSGGGLVSDTLARVVSDGEDAAWREAARQCTKNITGALAVALDKRLPSGMLGLALGKINTPVGQASVSFFAGHVMAVVPSFNQDARLRRLATEMRVSGSQFVLSMVADAVLDPIRDSIVEIVKGLTA
jgi:hypothetical protein